MLFRLRHTTAIVLLLVLSPWGTPEASAESVTYGWDPLVGGGSYCTYPDNQLGTFTSNNGSLLIGFDPYDLRDCYIDVWIGGAGFQVTADEDFQVWVSSGGVCLSAVGIGGQSATVWLSGDPGLLNPQGVLESLCPFLDNPASVSARGAYHDPYQFVFGGQTVLVPEPSSLLSLVLGIGGVSVAYAARRPSYSRDPRNSPIAGSPFTR